MPINERGGHLDSTGVVSVIILLSVLIFAHECGHFLVARILGVGVLKFYDFGLDDNYFDLGGNSLKMVHVLDHLQRELQSANYKKIPDMIELFTYPTIRSLAQFINEHQEEKKDVVVNYANKRRQSKNQRIIEVA